MLKALSAAAILTAGFAAAPASAQYYSYPPPQREYYGPQDRYEPRRPPRRWEEDGYSRPRPRPVPYGNLCVTSRGNCRSQPLPNQASCSCFIPGFGPKRGNILARSGY